MKNICWKAMVAGWAVAGLLWAQEPPPSGEGATGGAASVLGSLSARPVKTPEEGAADELYFLSQEFTRTRRLADAEKLLTRIVQEVPSHPLAGCALQDLGQLAFRNGERARARALFERALAEYPHAIYPDAVVVGVAAREYLASMMTQDGEIEQAQALINEILTSYPKAINHQGHPVGHGARFLLRLIRDTEKYGADRLSDIEEMYRRGARSRDALAGDEAFDELVKTYPESNWAGWARFHQGQRAHMEQDFDRAIQKLTEALDQWPDAYHIGGVQLAPAVLFELAAIAYEQDRLDDVEQFLDRIRNEYAEAINIQGVPVAAPVEWMRNKLVADRKLTPAERQARRETIKATLKQKIRVVAPVGPIGPTAGSTPPASPSEAPTTNDTAAP